MQLRATQVDDVEPGLVRQAGKDCLAFYTAAPAANETGQADSNAA